MGRGKREGKRIFFGAFQPTLERAFVDLLGHTISSFPLEPKRVLVPGNLLALHLGRLLAETHGGHANVRFSTLIDLAREAAAPALVSQGLSPLPVLGGELVVESVCARRLAGVGSFLASFSDRRGLCRALLSAFTDLAEARIGPADLRKAVSSTGGGSRYRERLLALADLYDEYRAEKKRLKRVDDSDLLELGAAAVSAGEALPPEVPVAVYGFYDLNPLQRSFIKACLCSVSSADVFFPWREGEAYAYARRTRDWFMRLGPRVEDPPDRDNDSATALGRLRARLFDPPDGTPQDARDSEPGRADSKGTVAVLSVPGEGAEVLEVVREVLRQVESRGLALHEIGVLCRSPGAYGVRLREAMDRAGIRHGFRDGVSLSDTRMGYSVELLLRITGGDLSRNTVMDFLTYAPVPFESLVPAGGPVVPSDWARLSIEAGIVGSDADEWIERLSAHASRLDRRGRDLEAVSEEGLPAGPERLGSDLQETRRLLRFVRMLFKEIRTVPEEAGWSKMAGAVEGLFQRTLASPDDGEGARAADAIKGALVALGSLQEVAPKVDFRRFRETLEEKLRGTPMSAARFERGGLFVSSMMTARGLPFRAVILPGLAEGIFPPPPRPDPLLSESIRQQVNRALGREEGEGLASKLERIEEERLLFELACSSAGERLVLTFPRIDPKTGRERVPAFFLLHIVEALTGLPCDFEGLTHSSVFDAVPLETSSIRDVAEALDEEEYDLQVAADALSRCHPESFAYLREVSPFFGRAILAEANRWKRGRFTEYDGRILSEDALRLLRASHDLAEKPISASRLECYATCPYQYFMRYVLRVAPVEEPERVIQIQPLERGMLIHSILQEFMEDLRDQSRLPLSPANAVEYRKRLLEIAGRRFGDFERVGRVGPPMMWSLARASMESEILEWLEKECAEEPGWVPTHFELRFGGKGREGAADPASTDSGPEIEIGPWKVRLRGRIDRIDFRKDSAAMRVIDYKTGRVSSDLREGSLLGGRSLQLPVYRLGAEAAIPGRRVERAEFLYFKGRRRGGSIGFTAEEFERRESDFRSVLRTIGEGIHNGILIAMPQDKTCRNCAYEAVCGSIKEAIYERKRDDTAAKDLQEMREIG